MERVKTASELIKELATLRKVAHAKEAHPEFEYTSNTHGKWNCPKHPDDTGWILNYDAGSMGRKDEGHQVRIFWMKQNSPLPTPTRTPRLATSLVSVD